MVLKMLGMVQQNIQKIVIPQPWVDTEPGDEKRMSASECFLVMTGDCDLFSMATELLLLCPRSGKRRCRKAIHLVANLDITFVGESRLPLTPDPLLHGQIEGQRSPSTLPPTSCGSACCFPAVPSFPRQALSAVPSKNPTKLDPTTTNIFIDAKGLPLHFIP